MIKPTCMAVATASTPLLYMHYMIWLLLVGDMMQLSLPVGNFNAAVLNSADQVILIAAGSGQFGLT